MLTDSLGGPLDPDNVKAGYHPGTYLPRHSATHVDCLVGGRKGPGYKNASKEYISDIRPLDIATFSGLNTKKMLGGVWKHAPTMDPPFSFIKKGEPLPIPSGAFEGQTIPGVAQSYNSAPYAAIIYGSNNRDFFNGKYTVEAALSMFFAEMSMVFKGSSFDVVFISTIFPRADDINERGELVTNIKLFNDALLSFIVRRDEKYKIHIRDGDGMDKVLPWVPVDMTSVLPYAEMRNQKYFCGRNLTHRKRNPDLIHFKAEYLEAYYCKLDLLIRDFIKRRRRRK